jgi:hypothetical protein
LRIAADVVDRDGNPLGSLEGICEKAVTAWQEEVRKLGLSL